MKILKVEKDWSKLKIKKVMMFDARQSFSKNNIKEIEDEKAHIILFVLLFYSFFINIV